MRLARSYDYEPLSQNSLPGSTLLTSAHISLCIIDIGHLESPNHVQLYLRGLIPKNIPGETQFGTC